MGAGSLIRPLFFDGWLAENCVLRTRGALDNLVTDA
jgi:hypothetical protein